MRGAFATVALAGGEGLRIGGGKRLHLLGGETLIARAHRMAQDWSYNVAVAVRTEAQIRETDAKLISMTRKSKARSRASPPHCASPGTKGGSFC